ncbi:MAG: class I SAM-dependent rRNA methyltransferase [Pirellulaceae bacterium]|nr:class I SAM-dependent rRNA methyltransferase [Pirellulaceae bacterium]
MRLKPSRQFPFLSRHPWVHAHALADDGRKLSCGQVVDLLDHDGNWIARGLINPSSRLRIRLYGFDSGIELGEDLWRQRIDGAIERRRLTGPAIPTGAERLIFSESDLLSGLIVDRYADCLGVQFTAGGLMRWREAILQHLKSALQARAIMVRVDAKTAKHEGISHEEGWYESDAVEQPVDYQLNALQLSVDLHSGQKTGGYLDQRDNHAVAAKYLVGRRVLDVCCYTGGFGLVAAKQGAVSVLGIDSSQAALDAAAAAVQRNGLANIEFQREDCFDALQRLGEAGEKFDAVVLDPPRFAGSRHQIDTAIRAYRRLNAMALDLLPPGGVLVTCSCSGRVSRADFLNMLVDVGRRRRRDLIVLESRGPAADHPVAVSCPESNYLKCMIVQVS